MLKQNSINIALSIHSYVPTEHDTIVNVIGAHEKVTTAVQLLQQYGIKYRIATIRHKSCHIGKPNKKLPYTLTPKSPKITV